MHIRHSLLAALALLTPVVLQATNPTIRVDRDPPDPVIVTSNSFTFGADNAGGGVLSFQNESGNNWTELSVFVTLPELTPITCGPGPFTLCTIATTPNNGQFDYSITFGPSELTAIANGELFSINLNNSGTDPNGSGSWPASVDFAGKANFVAPEPAAGMLALAGVLALGGFGAYRKQSQRRRLPAA
jgi:hypothetical protein